MQNRLRGWLPLAIIPATLIATLPNAVPPWVVMWTLSFAIYGCCKWLTWRQAHNGIAPFWQQLAYLFAWPGLDARAFLSPPQSPPKNPPPDREWYAAWLRLLLGGLMIWGVSPLIPAQWPLTRGWIGMIGLLQILHFGLFALLSCYWRSVGITAKPLMQQPFKSESLGEFWGRRWNTAFRDLTNQLLFRPLARKVGPIRSMWIGFLVSGLVHEMVITFPAQGGYGGPTTFFLLQAAGLSTERSRFAHTFGLGTEWSGRIFTALILLLPLPLLAPSSFILNVIVPFLSAIGATPRQLT